MRKRISRFLVGVSVVCVIFLCSCCPSKDAQTRGQSQPGAASYEAVYSESPAAWYEAANNAAEISSDGKWALYHHSFGRGIKLINLETGCEEAERLAAGMNRVLNAVFYQGNDLARLGERAGRRGWFLPSPGGPRLCAVPLDAMPEWAPDGSAAAYFRFRDSDQSLFVVDPQGEKQYSVEGIVTGLAWSPDGRLIYALVWHEDGLTSLTRINRETGAIETLAKDLDTLSWPSSGLGISGDGKHLYVALASPAAPAAEARHQPDADRDLDIYEMELATGTRRILVEGPGDDFAPCVANDFLYWTHNDIHDSVVVLPSSGGEARVVEDWAEIPYWSSDGKQIAYLRRMAAGGLGLEPGCWCHPRRFTGSTPIENETDCHWLPRRFHAGLVSRWQVDSLSFPSLADTGFILRGYGKHG